MKIKDHREMMSEIVKKEIYKDTILGILKDAYPRGVTCIFNEDIDDYIYAILRSKMLDYKPVLKETKDGEKYIGNFTFTVNGCCYYVTFQREIFSDIISKEYK